ncbi:hypothetical protein N7540_004698 [Penicillium herquei]|nr:hypothetical protein N7540_004698 [Penicillium herquei]
MASVYSSAQLGRYLDHLSLPTQYEAYVQDPHDFPKTEEALTVLFQVQITKFPYDNLSAFLSETRLVDIDPQKIYEKLLGSSSETAGQVGRGGYCLECNIFFYHVLQGLGFDGYMTGVRSRIRTDDVSTGDFKGWKHMVNIVKLPSGKEYHLDAAFGGDGPTKPVPLVSGQISQNLGTQEIRLIQDNMSKQTRLDQKHWIYQYRNGPEKKWEVMYSFTELEFFQDDFEVINHFTSWEALTTGTTIIVKFLRSRETDGLPLDDHEREGLSFESGQISIVGKIMFISGSPDLVKLNMGGKSRIVDSFQSEEERVSSLKKWFQIQL